MLVGAGRAGWRRRRQLPQAADGRSRPTLAEVQRRRRAALRAVPQRAGAAEERRAAHARADPAARAGRLPAGGGAEADAAEQRHRHQRRRARAARPLVRSRRELSARPARATAAPAGPLASHLGDLGVHPASRGVVALDRMARKPRARGPGTRARQTPPGDTMNGLMMQQPLLISSLLVHAERHHGEREIVSRRVEGDIHRYTYRELRGALAPAWPTRWRALGVQAVGDRVATLAWNGYRHMELYYARLAAPAPVLHTHQPAPAPRPGRLDRRPRRGPGAVLRPDLPAAGRRRWRRSDEDGQATSSR
ncbi:MAG: hypothetical protein MZW92_23220 [Comamonadaceae bacterium]|nr:hypothetical protein [Comamonadaceae bacterium]